MRFKCTTLTEVKKHKKPYKFSMSTLCRQSSFVLVLSGLMGTNPLVGFVKH